MSGDDVVIKATGLRQKFGLTVALEGIDLEIRKGESVCVIGPNGAGKTTLLMLLGGIYMPSRGDVTVFGLHRWRDNHAIRKRSVFLLAESHFGESPTPYEFLRFFAQIYSIPKPVFVERVERMSSQMKMSRHLKKPWAKLSLGMKKKTGLMATFLPDVELRILDEPFAGGIDPMAIAQLYEWMKEGKGRKETYVFSTQVLEQASDVAERVVLLNDGIVIAQGTPAEIADEAGIDFQSERALQKAFMALSTKPHP